MSESIVNLEQEIMKAWNVIDDIDLLYEYFGDDPFFKGMDAKHVDKIMNCMLGLKSIYDVRFDKLFRTFEQVSKEYYNLKMIQDNTYEN